MTISFVEPGYMNSNITTPLMHTALLHPSRRLFLTDPRETYWFSRPIFFQTATCPQYLKFYGTLPFQDSEKAGGMFGMRRACGQGMKAAMSWPHINIKENHFRLLASHMLHTRASYFPGPLLSYPASILAHRHRSSICWVVYCGSERKHVQIHCREVCTTRHPYYRRRVLKDITA